MRHAPIDPALFIAHRRQLLELLPKHCVAIVHAADVPPTNGDGTLKLQPAADLFWLTGIEQEESVLVLAPDAADPAQREMLFVREPTELLCTWEGLKLSKEHFYVMQQREKHLNALLERVRKDRAEVDYTGQSLDLRNNAWFFSKNYSTQPLLDDTDFF